MRPQLELISSAFDTGVHVCLGVCVLLYCSVDVDLGGVTSLVVHGAV
jgi:hypothetical protein